MLACTASIWGAGEDLGFDVRAGVRERLVLSSSEKMVERRQSAATSGNFQLGSVQASHLIRRYKLLSYYMRNKLESLLSCAQEVIGNLDLKFRYRFDAA